MSPNFLAVVFKKQAISQQVVTRMQDLASEFFLGVIPLDPHSGRRRPPPASNTQPGLWPGAGRKRQVCAPRCWDQGPKTLVPLNFLAVVAPLLYFLASVYMTNSTVCGGRRHAVCALGALR